jgi:hypothetical protein
MLQIIILTVLVMLLAGSIYAAINLLTKLEKVEDLLSIYEVAVEDIGKVLVESTVYLKELDEKGHFRADDEVGEFFAAMKEAQDIVNRVFVEYQDKLEEV